MPSRKAGRYELQEEIGRGAMGVVYKAIDPLIGRTVAVKTMRLEEMGGHTPKAELLSRFHAETHTAGLLSHPNIVVIYDAGADEDLFYITMEYVAGRSLQAMMEEKQAFPLPRLLRLMEQACRALDYAHQHNIVHRDVKPANILLGELDTVKITDFGTAKILEMGGTQTGHVIGTPSYMSPEQVKGRPVDGRADVFSLGVILYELVTGEKPFPGKNVTTVIYKIVHEDPIPPIELDASLHPGLNAVITKGLAKEPEDRYQSCGELLKALRNYREIALSQAPTLVMRAPALPSLAPPDATTQRQPPPRAPAGPPPSAPTFSEAATPASAPAPSVPPRVLYEPPPKRRKGGGVLWAIFLLLVLGVSGYYSWPMLHDLLERSGVQVGRSTPSGQTPSATGSGGASTTGAPDKPATENSGRESKTAPEKPAEIPPGKPPSKVPEKGAASSASSPGSHPAKEVSPTAPATLQQAKERLGKRLSEEGLADRVQVGASGNTLTLTGSLTKAEHRRLMRRMPALPGKPRVVDKIQIASVGGEEKEKPRTAPGKGEVEVVTDVLGARAALNGPQGNLISDCTTPCRFEDLSPGRYTMQVELEGYRPIKRILQVQAGHIVEERLSLQALASGLLVVSRPAGAQITINGQRQSQATPATIPLAPDRYSLVVEKAGYERYSGTVELNSDSLKRVDIVLVEQQAALGALEVRSIPVGADILINNKSTGRRTPARIELPAGQYTLTLYLKGYSPLERTVVVQESRSVQVNETLGRP